MSEKNKKQRKHFTHQFKRKVLLEYARGKSSSQILLEFGINLTEDKKYALKLIHKWKNELYKNIQTLSLSALNIDENYAEEEIDTIGKDEETDDILNEILTKNKNKKQV